ncbi:MAG: prepilin-type N-terminal cleavage/methylation domain-containing protein [Truepera sp.]|nr:prepilin-type N-terminal cleavage/methylation domain-containing protein [Truepera sp.]
MRRRLSSGMTLVELLVAMAVLGIILTVAYSAMVSSLRVQTDQEAITTSQAKLRRVVEVITQDLRSAVFGSITNQPFASNDRQISFALIAGGAGYQVLPHDSGNNNSFRTANNVQIIATVANAAELNLEGRQAMMVNANRRAVIVNVGNVTRRGGPGSVEWNVVHPGCANTIDYTPNTLLFRIDSLGLRYDAATRTLWQRRGATEVPLAFDISDFRLEYVYQDPAGITELRTTPHLSPTGQPVRQFTRPDGVVLQLVRLQVTISAAAPSQGRVIERSFTGQVELHGGHQSFGVDEVVPCN